MKNKDLKTVAIVAILIYLLFKRKPVSDSSNTGNDTALPATSNFLNRNR
jgi:hypothetical protein